MTIVDAPVRTFELNGRSVTVRADHAHLLAALRDELGITSTKDGGSPSGQCGCCTVLLDGKAVVTAAALKDAGVIRRPKDGVRLLANGEIKTAVKFQIAGASKAAIAAVEKAGGSVELIAVKKPASAEKAE